MQFVVPQFISDEAHILGPIAVRQFVIMLVAAGILFVIFKLTDFALFLVIGIPIILFTLVLAFYQPNGRPFHFFLLNLIQTLSRPSLRVWRKEVTAAEVKEELSLGQKDLALPTTVTERVRPTASRLAELALVVDTGGVYRDENK